jgi:hypothetical protein
MRIPLVVTSVALIALHRPVDAGPVRACEQVSPLVDAAVRPLLAQAAELKPDDTRLLAQFRDCLSAHNICTVAHNTRDGKGTLIAADVTADLPAQDVSGQGKATVIFVVRSIPPVGNDANQYCLLSERFSGASSGQQWNVYGWVLAPNTSEALPLEKRVLEDKAASDPRSLRGLAAALWFFAERMSGRPQ